MECLALLAIVGGALLFGYALYKIEDWWSSR